MKVSGLILGVVLSGCLLVLACRRSDTEHLAPAPQHTLSDSYVEAEKARLFMAGTEMTLGMPEEALVAKLKENYTLSSAGNHGWAIWEKDGPANKMVGAIGFTDGRLSWISKDWGYYESSEALSVGKELFSLMSSLADNKPTPVQIVPKVPVRQPGLVINEIELLYPTRTVSISVWESKEKGNGMAIREVLKTK